MTAHDDTAVTPTELLAAWDAQQTAFIEYREQRTRCVTMILAAHAATLGRPLRVLDLGCGPGSLANAVLDALPEATVTGVDRDPVLLRLFRESTPHPDKVAIVDADLRDDSWADHLPLTEYDAAISATALHWLDPDELVRAYGVLGRVIASGGLVLNADHLLFDEVSEPTIRRIAIDVRAAAEVRLRAQGAMSWDDWWALAFGMPGWEAEAEEYHRRWQGKDTVIKVSPEFHLSALQAAGFRETSQVWQWLDDRIVYGRKPLG